MNEIVERNNQLPDTLEDLTQFVLVGKAKLQAYMLKLQTVNKLSVAQEIRDQTLKETQEVSNALIAAEQRIGELLLAIPKQTGNQYTSASDERPTKAQTIADMGYGATEAKDYQQMARHPEVVQKVIDDALANGDVVTKASVMREIKHYKDRVKAQQEEINALRNQEPEVIEREIIREVVPDDYAELQDKARRIDGYQKDYVDMRKRYEEATDKLRTSEREKEKLIEEMKRPETERKERITKSALAFCGGVANFIEKYGGYDWLIAVLDDMDESERSGYIKAVDMMDDWVASMRMKLKGEITV